MQPRTVHYRPVCILHCAQTSPGHQRLGTEDQDPADRRRITQVLRALLTRADVDVYGREGTTAAHMAAAGDSSKLMALLCEHKVRTSLSVCRSM
jgi:ankyrin repeat protein